jgi:DNA-binding winged helix-turn-helix (wHTH) protein/TolB-like protein
MSTASSPTIHFGPYAFELDTGELTKNGHLLSLRKQCADILRYLLTRPGELVTREDLARELWAAGTHVDAEHGLNLCIHEIRAALHDDPIAPRYIETFPRRGYRFIGTIDAPVTLASETSPSDAPSPPETFPAPTTVSPSRFQRMALLVVGALTAAGAIGIASNRSIDLVTDSAAIVRGAGEIGSVPSPRPAAVALLPLIDMAARPDEQFLAEGISWELQRHLEAMDSLRVKSRWSVLPYAKTKKSPAQIGRELDVTGLVSGSILQIGDRTRLNLKLIDARTSRPLWAETYDTTLADLPKVEIDAARMIARNLAGATRVKREPPAQAQVNAEAHIVLLRAMGASTMEDYRFGLERAITIDPEFALGWSLLADSYVSDTWFAQTISPMVGYPRAKELALRALAIDDTDSSAHTTVAAVKLHHEWDWAGAEREFKRAIELSPSDAWAHHIYSHYLLTMDRLSESVAESRIASALDPLNPTLATCVGWHCLYARQYEDAIAECLKLINDNKAGPITYYYLGRVYVRQGKLPEGIAALEIADKKSGSLNSVLATLAFAYGRAGRRADAERALAILRERAATRYVAAFDMAIVYAGLGDLPNTFEWLDRAFLERSTWLVHIKWDDRFAGVRDDPRFSALLKRMGVPNPNSVRQPENLSAEKGGNRPRFVP